MALGLLLKVGLPILWLSFAIADHPSSHTNNWAVLVRFTKLSACVRGYNIVCVCVGADIGDVGINSVP